MLVSNSDTVYAGSWRITLTLIYNEVYFGMFEL